ncbi:hypothetical protein G6O67_008173 [Ophiocordyceps sinensis]|uniref:Uncharacterized protein n=2 Tax=Ophiocordyceps sinensis TaxID=72228 RepID=A0A8H4LSX7_9HYPO|nr:hypothetical protein OCS_00260 [Ophiocordyceps sinensis CO18]KAF4504764.1 hypothetical protein G6O67_008173 [Ophiocordyceps sinensis]
MPSTLRISRRLAALTTRGRTYHATPRALRPHKDSKDRESENSGRDREMAGNSDAAFDPRKTRPESEGRTAEAWSNDDPPEANGANQELSKPRGDERSKADRGAGDQVRKGGRSGGGNTTKKGGPGRV